MDLMQENPIKEKKSTKIKISFIIVIVLIVILIISAVVLWLYSQKLQAQLFKVNIDGILNSKASNEEGLFIIENEKVYTSISGICSYIGYTYYPGSYGQYSEDKTKCYINNTKEIVSFSSGSDEIFKYTSDGAQSQKFEIGEEVILRGEKLYINESGLSKAFNVIINYNDNNNTVSITTLPYLSTYYERNIADASLEKSGFEDKIKFNNEKALLNNLIVIQDADTKLFGVKSIKSPEEITTVITPRYSKVEYMEGTEDFIVTTEDKKVGIIGSDGMTKVKPDYDSIDIIDKNVNLYLVSSNGKQGVINSNGKIIIHQDYDSIGLDQGSYDDVNVVNRYLLFEKCIPVKLNNKWGIIDINGETITEIKYDGIGCNKVENNTGAKNTNGIVLIPEIDGIVVKVNNVGNDSKTIISKYGIINSNGELMVNTAINSAYATTLADVTTYYVTVDDQTIDIVKWWHEQENKQ